MKSKMKKKTIFCYKGFVMKAISFSIDDGNLPMDEKLLKILRPYGIRGTFNLTNTEKLSPEQYRAFYAGHGIANHCKGHPMVFIPGAEYKFSPEALTEENADESLLYPTADPRVFHMYPYRWRTYTDRETYYAFSEESREALLSVFGESAVKDFVWPHGQQADPALHEMLKKRYRSIRKTGSLLDTTGFSLPTDLHAWTYNAVHDNLLSAAALYEAYPDDGELKLFCFGVHSVDYESSGRWEDLRLFGERMGNRPEKYWYAPIGEIFDYKEAVEAVTVSEDRIENPTDTEIYMLLDGERITLMPHSALRI